MNYNEIENKKSYEKNAQTSYDAITSTWVFPLYVFKIFNLSLKKSVFCF